MRRTRRDEEFTRYVEERHRYLLRAAYLICGDLHPGLGYVHESDPELARSSRQRMLDQGLPLATAHLGTPYLKPPFRVPSR
ncbi:MAG TPA: hypothetical protein PLZ93_10940 [Nocardioides sp.]|uniref:hypothetical protein n=1 Tax=uncultured Nocardioides sp. TaxID=198441 RepID=UPI002624A4B0|nr:hypothetical protein [uncultured Nocardioides sp.]HRD61884.1 hypothetical protein [Nocardioides sp.]HRI96121.1 hypothetical protein [Nocardioides sp.]HRK45448.1 hypothetical protein [Nocardioides sp.]